jgi:hypothetical protein
VHLKPDELWREARHACHRRDQRAQRFMLKRLVNRYPSSAYAPPARQHLESMPVCRADDDGRHHYDQNIDPGGSDSTQTSDGSAPSSSTDDDH